MQTLLTQHVAALWLAYKPLTRPDRALLERCDVPSDLLLPIMLKDRQTLHAFPQCYSLPPTQWHSTDACIKLYCLRNLPNFSVGVMRSMVPTTDRDSSAKAARAAAANSAALRRHFAALTTALLAPLLPFMEPAPPPAGDAPIPLGSSASFITPPAPSCRIWHLIACAALADAPVGSRCFTTLKEIAVPALPGLLWLRRPEPSSRHKSPYAHCTRDKEVIRQSSSSFIPNM